MHFHQVSLRDIKVNTFESEPLYLCNQCFPYNASSKTTLKDLCDISFQSVMHIVESFRPALLEQRILHLYTQL